MVSDPNAPLQHPLGEGGDPAPPIHAPAWALAQRQWAAGAPLPWLHQEVARRMADRLSVIRVQPSVILEWDALAGQSRPALQAAVPAAQWVPVAPTRAALERIHSGGYLNPSQPPQPPQHLQPQPTGLLGQLARIGSRARGLFTPGREATPAPAAQPRAAPGFLDAEVPAGHGQLLWSNLGLHTHARPADVLRRWHAALAVDGFLMFSTFGPDTLRQWRGLWESAAWGPPAQPFRDMHDWGDDLVAAGFADPVMDQETVTLTWASPAEALAELRTMGRNAHPGRYSGCRTPRWRARLEAAVEQAAGPDGRVALGFEIIYGHAFRPVPRSRLQATTTVSLDDMRHMVKTPRRPR